MRTALAVIASGALVAGSAQARVRQAPAQALSAPGFTTQFPGDWKHARAKVHGITYHTLTSPGARVPDKLTAVPAPGGISITITTNSTATFRRNFKRAAPRSGKALMVLVGIPRIAKHVRRTVKPTLYTLAGSRGVTASFGYTYKRVANLQRDVAARRGNRLVLIELNCRPDLEPAGQAALNMILSSWRWR